MPGNLCKPAGACGGAPLLDALVQHVEITEHRTDAAERLARRVGSTAADVLRCPYVLIGTVSQLIEELSEHPERWGFTSYVRSCRHSRTDREPDRTASLARRSEPHAARGAGHLHSVV